MLVVISYQTEEEAVAIANNTIYGLGGAVWAAHGISKLHRQICV